MTVLDSVTTGIPKPLTISFYSRRHGRITHIRTSGGFLACGKREPRREKPAWQVDGAKGNCKDCLRVMEEVESFMEAHHATGS